MKIIKNYKIYKPYGYLSQFVNNQNTRKNKRLLGELFPFPEGTMAIGRLDEDSEGLLLLSTHGKVSEKVRSKQIEKEYYVQVDGNISSKEIAQLQQGVEIAVHGKAYKTLTCSVRFLSPAPEFPERSKKIRNERHGPTSWISITLTEGKFRQVKKMTAKVGFPTLRLVRVRIGQEYLKEMQPGEVKVLDTFLL